MPQQSAGPCSSWVDENRDLTIPLSTTFRRNIPMASDYLVLLDGITGESREMTNYIELDSF
jgi:hypothetical protein